MRTVKPGLLLACIVLTTASCKPNVKAPPDNRALSLRSIEATDITFDTQITQSEETQRKVAESINAFTLQLFAQILHAQQDKTNPAATTTTKNVVLSGLSIFNALSLVLPAWDGGSEARQQTLSTLYRGETLDAALVQANGLFRAMRGWVTNPNSKLEIINSVFTDESIRPKPEYLSSIKRYLDAGILVDKLHADLEGTRRRLNQFVSDKTNKVIPELFRSGDLTADTVAVLLNTFYMKAPWLKQFAKEMTTKETFTDEAGATYQVDMMKINGLTAPYVESTTLKAVSLSFDGAKARLIVVLPQVGTTISSVVSAWQADPNAFKQLLTNKDARAINLHLPKVQLVDNSDGMETHLKNIGLTALQKNSLTGIDPRSSISIIKHQAVFKIDEQGVEAAAATGIGVDIVSAPVDPIAFEVNRAALLMLVAGDEPFVLMAAALSRP